MLDYIAFFVFATLSGMGIGSAGLPVIYLTLWDGMSQLAAQGINLMFFIFSSGASLLFNLGNRKILFSVTLLMSAAGAIGAFCGFLTASSIDPSLIRILFGIMLIVSGSISLFSKKSSKDRNADAHKNDSGKPSLP